MAVGSHTLVVEVVGVGVHELVVEVVAGVEVHVQMELHMLT